MPERRDDLPPIRRPFELEGWRVEPQANRVSSGQTIVRLEPKAMEVLLCLAQHSGEVVPRRTLVDRVWATEFITDSTLTHTIADLRRAFGDDPRAPRFIETIPKRGYRLVPEIGLPEGASAPPTASPGARLGGGPLAVLAGDRLHISELPVDPACECFLFVAGGEIPLPVPSVTFGRDRGAEIQILAPEVSRLHARLDLDHGRATLEDLGSKNGTTLNDRPIDGRQPVASGDTIGVGPFGFVFRCLITEPTRTRGDT